MDVTFKSVGNKTLNFKVDSNDTVESVFPQIHSELKTSADSHSIKVILQGKIIDPTAKFSDFGESKVSFVFINSKNKPPVQPAPQNQSESKSNDSKPSVPETTKSVQPSTPATQPVENSVAIPNPFTQSHDSDEGDEDFESLDSVDKLRAAVVGVLAFVRANPQLVDLFNNNFEMLVGVLTSQQIRPLFEKMVGNGQNSNSDYLDNLTESIYESQNGSETTNQQTQPTTQVSLSETDMNNINTLVALGFPQSDCVRAYIVCNKNINLAASMLMDDQ